LKSVKPLPRYGDFSIFQGGDRHHLGVLNFKFLTERTLKRVELRHLPTLVEIGQTVDEIWRFFYSFEDSGRRHLGFLKYQIFNG